VALFIKWALSWLVTTRHLKTPDYAAEVGRVRTALLATIGGVLAATGVIYTAKTYALNRQGQITERFTRAIDQLGHETIDIRLGGIYALERIADESAQDYGPVLEILASFVREHVPSFDVDRPERDQAEPSTRPGPPTDVQSVLTVLGRRRLDHDKGHRVDLSGGLDLRRASFTDGYFARADFGRSNLSGARMFRVRLSNANFISAKLSRVLMTGGDASGATFLLATMDGAQLASATLMGTSFRAAKLGGANLRKADLRGANLVRTDLSDARLGEAKLADADLTEATLTGADLADADLNGAVLTDAKFDDGTVWPGDFKPIEHGAIHVDASPGATTESEAK
jgi:hypothetical protein